MRRAVLLITLSLATLPVLAENLTCEALRDRLDAKLQAKGVPSYTLELVPSSQRSKYIAASGVPATQPPTGKIVGACEGGARLLIYTRGY